MEDSPYARIKLRLAQLKISEKEICRRADVNGHTIQNIKNGHQTSMETIAKLAVALDLPLDYLVNVTSDGGHIPLKGDVEPIGLTPVYVVGSVQAGHWVNSLELPREDWQRMVVATEPEFARFPKFGLRLIGPSMNLLFPDGTTLICVKFIELGRGPEDGEIVICERRGPADLFEATCKLFVIEGRKRRLYPQSSHKDHQQALTLKAPRPDDQNEDVRVTALVINAVLPVRKRKLAAR